MLPAFFAAVPFQKAKRLLHKVVSSLRLDCHVSCGRVDLDGICKELVPIFVNLFDYLGVSVLDWRHLGDGVLAWNVVNQVH